VDYGFEGRVHPGDGLSHAPNDARRYLGRKGKDAAPVTKGAKGKRRALDPKEPLPKESVKSGEKKRKPYPVQPHLVKLPRSPKNQRLQSLHRLKKLDVLNRIPIPT
jgi:hypothetical protein